MSGDMENKKNIAKAIVLMAIFGIVIGTGVATIVTLNPFIYAFGMAACFVIAIGTYTIIDNNFCMRESDAEFSSSTSFIQQAQQTSAAGLKHHSSRTVSAYSSNAYHGPASVSCCFRISSFFSSYFSSRSSVHRSETANQTRSFRRHV